MVTLIIFVTETPWWPMLFIYRGLQALKRRVQIFPQFPTHNHLVLNVVITWYALIVPHISECWPADSLIRMKHIAAIKY